MKTWVHAGILVALAGAALNCLADLPATIAKLKPSILIVGTYKETNSPRFNLRGSGFVVAFSGLSVGGVAGGVAMGNLAVTNAHVLPEANPAEADPAQLMVQVRNAQNELSARRASVLEVDKTHDLALLKFDGPAAPAMALRSAEPVREGQNVALMGFPIGGALGFSPVTHRGIISSITSVAIPPGSSRQLNAASVRALRDGNFEVYQLDATAYPGNSGGPLFDPESGELLGVINSVFIKGSRESALTSPSGITYAIPAQFVRDLVQRNQGK